MAPEQSSQTEAMAVSPVQSSASPSTQLREPSPLAQTPQRASVATNVVQNPYGLYPQSYGAHYVPYDQTAPQQLRQMQQQPAQMGQQPVTYMTVPQPFQQPPESNKRKVSRDVMHVIVMIISILGIGFSFSLLGRAATAGYTDRYGYYYDDYDYYIPAMSAGPIFVIALLWSLIELVVRCCRKWKAGIHPGAHVGVCLCIWLGAVIVGSILAVLITQYWYLNCDSSSSSSSRYNRCSKYQDPMFVGSTVLVLILAVVEIVIFIVACADTHIRNKWKRNVVIASTPYWAPPPQGWYVAPGQQQPQQPQQQYMPMAQPPMNHVPAMQTQPPMMANTRAAPNAVEPHAGAAETGGSEKTPAQAAHGVREFYTPGTAQ